jgi:hypothetical protein
VINFEQFLQIKISTLFIGVELAYAFARPLDAPMQNDPLLPKITRMCWSAKRLESFGYTLLIAPTGGECLDLAPMDLVDLVIVDYFIPEMNGQGVAIEMRRLMPHAPITMLYRSSGCSGAGPEVGEHFHSQRSSCHPVVACPCAIAGRLIDCEVVSAFYPNSGLYERKLTSLLPNASPCSTSLTLTRRSMQKKDQ